MIKISDIRVHPGDSAFLLDDGTTSIMYDSGFGFTGFDVAKKIKTILGERKLDYIFLTHSHYDHALGSAYVLETYPDAKVVAGEYAAKIFAKPTAKSLMRELDGKLAKKCGVENYDDLSDNLRVDIPVSDGDSIKAGDMEFTVINLPGHTKCSVGYYCAKEKLLLSCETIGVFNGEDEVVPSYLVGYNMTVESMEKLDNIDIKTVLAPHFGVLDETQTEFYLKKAKTTVVETTEEIVQMFKDKKSKDEIAQFFKDKFYHGYIKEIYPVDAMELNTGITINLIEKEFELM